MERMSATAKLVGVEPCPFCKAGSFEMREGGKIWLGTRYSEPVSYTLLHWCGTADLEDSCYEETDSFSEPIKMKGKTENEAIAKWDRRA